MNTLVTNNFLPIENKMMTGLRQFEVVVTCAIFEQPLVQNPLFDH